MLIRFYKRRIKKLRKLAAEPEVDLWALDEVHFQQHSSRCRMWVPPEVKEPVLLHAPHTQKRRIFRSRTITRRKIPLRSRRGKIQCSKLLAILEAIAPQKSSKR